MISGQTLFESAVHKYVQIGKASGQWHCSDLITTGNVSVQPSRAIGAKVEPFKVQLQLVGPFFRLDEPLNQRMASHRTNVTVQVDAKDEHANDHRVAVRNI